MNEILLYLKWCKEKDLKPNRAGNLHRFISLARA